MMQPNPLAGNLDRPIQSNLHTLIAWLTSRSGRWALVIALVAVATALRFYQLGAWSFWRDEWFTISGQEDGFNYSLLRQSSASAVIQAIIGRWGVTEWYARLFPAAVGVATVPVLYLLVRRTFGTAVALTAALLLALSPWHLYWSQNARFYTLLLLFYTIALFLFYEGLRNDRPLILVAALVFLGLAARERLLALFLVPVAAIFVISLLLSPDWRQEFKGMRWRNALLFVLPATVGGLYFISPFLLSFGDWMSGFGHANNAPWRVTAASIFYLGWPTVIIAMLTALYGLLRRDAAVWLLTLSATLPLLILALIAPWHYTASRYAFVTLTSWITLSALGAVTLITLIPKDGRLLALGALLLLIVTPLHDNFLYFYTNGGNRPDWQAAFATMSDLQPDDLVYTSDPGLASYYLGRETRDILWLDPNQAANAPADVWIVEDSVSRERLPETHDWLRNNAQLTDVLDNTIQAQTFTMRVYRYRPQ